MSESGSDLSARVERLEEENAQLQQAMATRGVIDQARGMVMALVPCTATVAWEVLVETSQHTNTKLREVAASLVATTGGTEMPDEIGRALAAAFRRRRTRP